MSLRSCLGIVAAILLVVAHGAIAAPSVERGWPRVATAYDTSVEVGWPAVPWSAVLPGSNGDARFVSRYEAYDGPHVSTLSLRRDGGRRLLADRPILCGNCDGNVVLRRQPDGSYSYDDPIGGKVEVCPGVVLVDGTCIFSTSRAGVVSVVSPPQPIIAARRAGVTLWEYVEPDFYWSNEGVPPRIARGAEGVVYVAYGSGVDGRSVPAVSRLLAINPDGSLRWRRLGTPFLSPGEVVGALNDGVLVSNAGSVRAISRDGADRWSLDGGVGHTPGVSVDAIRDRVYVTSSRPAPAAIIALDGKTGTRLWSTSGGGIADIGSGGRVYIADAKFERGSAGGVRAIGLDGRVKWRFRTTNGVSDAAELSDGRIALATADGLAYRINPKRSAPRAPRTRVNLSRRVIHTRCGREDPPVPPCHLSQRWGSVLRLKLPRAAEISLSLEAPGGAPWPGLQEPFRFDAPRGRSHTRLFAGNFNIQRGPAVVVLTWMDRGRPKTKRLPVRFR